MTITKVEPLTLSDVSTPTVPKVTVAVDFSNSATSFITSTELKQSDGTSITGKAIIGIKSSNGFVEEMYLEAGDIVGTTITPTTRGLKKAGLDVTTSDSTLKPDVTKEGSEVFIVVSGIMLEQFLSFIQGVIASGGLLVRVGDLTDSDVYYYAANGDANEPFLKYVSASNKWVFSNDGVAELDLATGGISTAGDGIDITGATISVDLGTDSGLEFDTAKLEVKVKASGGIQKDSDGLSIDQSNVKIAEDVAVTATSTEINQVNDGVSVNVTAANLNTLNAGQSSDANGLHRHLRTFGVGAESVAATTDTLNIAHSLGTTPNWIKIEVVAEAVNSSTPWNSMSLGEFDGTNYGMIYRGTGYDGAGDPPIIIGNSTTKILRISFDDGTSTTRTIEATATLTSTEIQLAFTNSSASARTIQYKWEAGI